jgi:hypothetical protein
MRRGRSQEARETTGVWVRPLVTENMIRKVHVGSEPKHNLAASRA